MRIVSCSATETKSLGKAFSQVLIPGDIILLDGVLGVGKTTFIKGVFSRFSFKDREIVSPSFTIIREYRYKKMPLYHIDLYRIEASVELKDLGYQDYFYSPRGITFIEWGQRIERMVSRYLKVDISFLGSEKRVITVSSKGYPQNKLKPFKKVLR